MPSPSHSRRCAALAAACMVLACLPCAALEPATATAKKPDWAGLDSLLGAGEYGQAARAADEIATAFKPARRDPDFLAESIVLFRALLRRGFAELRLGRLDAAAKTFDQARRIPRDDDFKRLMANEARNANQKTVNVIIPLDINFVELLELQMMVTLERLRRASLEHAAEGAPSEEQEAKLRVQVEEWLDDLDGLEKSARDARESLAERLEKAGPTYLSSPHNRALVGRFRPALVAGVRALELSRLPFGDPRSAAGPAPAEEGAPDRLWLADSRRQFREAATALEEAIAATTANATALRPEPTIEILLMRVELCLREGEALLASADPKAAREKFVQAAELVQQIAVLRKLKQPESHPDLFQPLLLGAEATLDEARRQIEKGDPTEGRKTVVAASKLLARAEALPVPQDHPLRAMLRQLQARLGEGLAEAGERIPGADAADAAARRLRRALDGAAVSSDFVP